MIRNLMDYGLKESYDFKEIHIPTIRTIPGTHDNIVGYIAPAVTELEASGLINGFHFILHKDIDLRISTEDWGKNEDGIKKILRENKISDDLVYWEMGSPERYGGDLGVILCYNNLEFNSRLILVLLDVERANDIAIKSDPRRLGYNHLVCTQWVHYLYCQYGLNDSQVQLEFEDSLGWLLAHVSRDPKNMGPAINILDRMINAIDQVKGKLGNRETE